MDEPVIRKLDEPGDLGWVVMCHGEIYASEFGYDREFETLVASMVSQLSARRDERRERGFIAVAEGRRLGCAFVVARDQATAQLRMLLVRPEARGRRLGTQLVQACLEFARAANYRRVVLRTNPPMTAAQQIYLTAGFQLVHEEACHKFGVDLIERDYALDLIGPLSTASDG
jgi:GNAT superfamily N-acetyltransferase